MSSETSGCTVISSGATWWNQAFAQQTGKFHVTFSATPSADYIDAVVGFSNGPASDWTKLAAIVRFSPAGVIDVRKGGVYAVDVQNQYRGGQTFTFRVDIDVKAHIYSVYLKDWSGNFAPIATNYPFRTEQASVTSLDNTASYLEPSSAGNLDVCGTSVVQDDSFANDCITAAGGGAFSNIQLDATSGVLMTHFTAAPSQANMDGVVGFASGNVDSYNDYAASVRFWTNGMIEARDGDTYRAAQPLAYQAGTKYVFHTIIDLQSKTYSVEVAPYGNSDFVEIAHAFKFRSQQLGITSLDHASTVVASTNGRVDACALRNESWSRNLKFAHRGYASITPLANGRLVMSDATQTWIADGNGVPLYVGAPAGVVATNGAQDALYIANAANGVLTLSAYSMILEPQWAKTYPIEGQPGPMGVYTDGTIAIAIENDRLVTFHPDGSIGDQNIGQFSPNLVAISPWGYGLVEVKPDGLQLESYTPDGSLRWQRFWSGSFGVEHFVPNMAAFVLTGQFYTTVDFGDGAMEPISNPDTSLNTFVLSVNANGLVTFSKRLYSSYSTGLATNGTDIAVSTMRWTQSPRMEFSVLDRTGAGLLGFGGDLFYGFTQGVAIAPNRRTFVNMGPMWGPSFAATPWEHVFAFDPQ